MTLQQRADEIATHFNEGKLSVSFALRHLVEAVLEERGACAKLCDGSTYHAHLANLIRARRVPS